MPRACSCHVVVVIIERKEYADEICLHSIITIVQQRYTLKLLSSPTSRW